MLWSSPVCLAYNFRQVNSTARDGKVCNFSAIASGTEWRDGVSLSVYKTAVFSYKLNIRETGFVLTDDAAVFFLILSLYVFLIIISSADLVPPAAKVQSHLSLLGCQYVLSSKYYS
jgi:hypothetical protein